MIPDAAVEVPAGPHLVAKLSGALPIWETTARKLRTPIVADNYPSSKDPWAQESRRG